jgi:hypothetical protein
VPQGRGNEAGKKPEAPISLHELSMEVNALETLRLFKFTPAQMEMLQKMAKETVATLSARQSPKASGAFRTALVDLRNALVDNDDEDRTDQLRDQLDELREAEKPEIDDEVEITDEAGDRVAEVLRLLSPRQVATYLAAEAQSVPDPFERMTEAFDKVRGLDPKEWKRVREEISVDVGRMIAGLDFDKANRVGDQVVQLLIQVRALKEDEFKTERPELEKAARKIVEGVGPMEVLRHVVEETLAELLSNPRLPHALEACLSK